MAKDIKAIKAIKSIKETDYAYAVSYMRTLENKMLGRSDFEILLNANSTEDILKYLSDRSYCNRDGNAKTGQNYDNIETIENMLKSELAYTYKEIKNACPQDAPVNILIYQNDFHNLKAILKSVFSNSKYENLMLEPYTVAPDIIYHAVSNGRPETLPDIFKKPAAEAYDILARDDDGQLAEIILDKALFSAMKEIARQSKNDFLIDWIELNIAIMNMKIALRGAYGGKSREFLRNAMLDCEKISVDYLSGAAADGVSEVFRVFKESGFDEAAKAAGESVGGFEKWCDNKIIGYLKPTRYKTFGFEPVLGFLVGKQFELQAARIVLSGIRSGISKEKLRERLRDLYV